MPQNYYELLGIDAQATNAEVKAAFRARAKDLHPDLSSGDSKELHDSFVAITEAYDVLKDAARRYQYDAARSAIPRQTPTKGPTAPYDTRSDVRQQAPFGDSEEAFDAAFKRWWERGGANWQQRAAEEHHAPNTAEYRRQQAEAWQAEKVEAQFNKARFDRIKQRTKQARAARHAAILRGAWQTRTGLVWADAFVAAAAVAASIGIAAFWAPILASQNEVPSSLTAQQPSVSVDRVHSRELPEHEIVHDPIVPAAHLSSNTHTHADDNSQAHHSTSMNEASRQRRRHIPSTGSSASEEVMQQSSQVSQHTPD